MNISLLDNKPKNEETNSFKKKFIMNIIEALNITINNVCGAGMNDKQIHFCIENVLSKDRYLLGVTLDSLTVSVYSLSSPNMHQNNEDMTIPYEAINKSVDASNLLIYHLYTNKNICISNINEIQSLAHLSWSTLSHADLFYFLNYYTQMATRIIYTPTIPFNVVLKKNDAVKYTL